MRFESSRFVHLSSEGGPICDHVGCSWDDVDSKGYEEGAYGGVDGAEERECDGQEPDG